MTNSNEAFPSIESEELSSVSGGGAIAAKIGELVNEASGAAVAKGSELANAAVGFANLMKQQKVNLGPLGEIGISGPDFPLPF